MKQYASLKWPFAHLRVFGAFGLCLTGACLAILPFLSRDLLAAVERRVGRWQIVPSPNATETHDNVLNSASCTDASNCWAVGYYRSDVSVEIGFEDQFISQTLIEHWNGKKWKIVNSANTSPTEFNGLSSVACVSAKDCWAVGGHSSTNGGKPLIEHWNGKRWVIVASPDINNDVAGLSSVTCLSHSDCWAVGQHVSPSPLDAFNRSLVIHWDGTFWRVIESPNSAPDQGNSLSAVSCITAADCHAIGIHGTGIVYPNGVSVYGPDATLAERWNGSSWNVVSSPNAIDSSDNYLFGIACPSSSNCWAVGYYNDNFAETLIERWNGNSWTVDPSPSNPIIGVLSAVACSSRSECWAVGENLDGPESITLYGVKFNHIPLIERWDGSSWTIVPLPNAVGKYRNYLQSVACVSSQCWSVGAYTSTDFISRTLIAHYGF